MSKHIGRKENWVKVSPTRHIGLYGYVECNKRGLWDAVIQYQVRTPIPKEPPKELSIDKHFKWPNWIMEHNYRFNPRAWRKTRMHCGEFRRAREAMMAVEQKIKELKADNNPDVLL